MYIHVQLHVHTIHTCTLYILGLLHAGTGMFVWEGSGNYMYMYTEHESCNVI